MVGMEKTTTDRKGRIIPTTEFEEHIQDLIEVVEELLEVASGAGTAIIPPGSGLQRVEATIHSPSGEPWRGGGWNASRPSSTPGVSSRVTLSESPRSHADSTSSSATRARTLMSSTMTERLKGDASGQSIHILRRIPVESSASYPTYSS